MNKALSARLLPLLLFICVAASPAQAALGRIECREMQSRILRQAVRYCAILPPNYDTEKVQSFPVLYLFHGLGENEQMLVRSGGWNLIEDLWEERKIGQFLIVTPDADTTFYINSRDGKTRYEDFFLREFIPFVEKTYRAQRSRSGRGIGGISMGGYGALHIAFGHPDLFAAVSAHSAALIARLPEVKFANPQRSPLAHALRAFGIPPDPAFWKRNDPLELARIANLRGLAIYFDCGAQDDYGFENGAEALDKILTRRGIPHEFHLYPGGHDWMYFAAHLPASLEFQSRILTAGKR